MTTKFSLCVFTLAVLLGAVASDLGCIVNQLVSVNPDNFFKNPVSSCQDVEKKFIRIRKELKDCSRSGIDISLVESLHKDFCAPNSDFRRKFNRQERCLVSNFHNTVICARSILSPENLSPSAIMGKSPMEICESSSQQMYDCLNDKIARPCGTEALEVYGRMMKSSQPFAVAVCLEAAGVGDDYSDSSDDISVLAGAGANSAFFWCTWGSLLLALYFSNTRLVEL